MDHCDTLHLSHAHITCPHCIKKEPNQRGVGHLGSVFFSVFPINKANTWKYPWAKLPISLCNFIWNLGYVFQRSDWRINNSKDWVSVSQLMDSEWKYLAGVPFVTIRCPVINKIQSCSVHVATEITCNVWQQSWFLSFRRCDYMLHRCMLCFQYASPLCELNKSPPAAAVQFRLTHSRTIRKLTALWEWWLSRCAVHTHTHTYTHTDPDFQHLQDAPKPKYGNWCAPGEPTFSFGPRFSRYPS